MPFDKVRDYETISKERSQAVHKSSLSQTRGAWPIRDAGVPPTPRTDWCIARESLGGISRLTFQMSVAGLSHANMMMAVEMLGTKVRPMVQEALGTSQREPTLSATSDRAA